MHPQGREPGVHCSFTYDFKRSLTPDGSKLGARFLTITLSATSLFQFISTDQLAPLQPGPRGPGLLSGTAVIPKLPTAGTWRRDSPSGGQLSCSWEQLKTGARPRPRPRPRKQVFPSPGHSSYSQVANCWHFGARVALPGGQLFVQLGAVANCWPGPGSSVASLEQFFSSYPRVDNCSRRSGTDSAAGSAISPISL